MPSRVWGYRSCSQYASRQRDSPNFGNFHTWELVIGISQPHFLSCYSFINDWRPSQLILRITASSPTCAPQVHWLHTQFVLSSVGPRTLYFNMHTLLVKQGAWAVSRTQTLCYDSCIHAKTEYPANQSGYLIRISQAEWLRTLYIDTTSNHRYSK